MRTRRIADQATSDWAATELTNRLAGGSRSEAPLNSIREGTRVSAEAIIRTARPQRIEAQ